MNFLTIVVIGFLIMEARNVLALYFHPWHKICQCSRRVQRLGEIQRLILKMHDFREIPG